MADLTTDVPLSEQDEVFWVNTILYRLALALGYEPDPEDGGIDADPDEILEEAERRIEEASWV